MIASNSLTGDGRAGGLAGADPGQGDHGTLAELKSILGDFRHERAELAKWKAGCEAAVTNLQSEISKLGKQPLASTSSSAPAPTPAPAGFLPVGTGQSDADFEAQLQQALYASSQQQQDLQDSIDFEPDEETPGSHVDLSTEELWVWSTKWASLVAGDEARVERFHGNVERYLRPLVEARDWKEVEHHLKLLRTLLVSPSAGNMTALFTDLRNRWWYFREMKRKGAAAAAATFDRLVGHATLPQDVKDATLLASLDQQGHKQARAAQHQLGGRRGAGSRRGDKKQGGGQRGGSGRPGQGQH